LDAHDSAPDPWGLNHASRRDRALGKIIGRHVDGRSVLMQMLASHRFTVLEWRNLNAYGRPGSAAPLLRQ
jgi:hypothetical protein